MGTADWRASSYTDEGEPHVEVAPAPDGVYIRDAKDAGSGPILRTSYDEWAEFLSTHTGMGLRQADQTAPRYESTVTQHEGLTSHYEGDSDTRWHLSDSRGSTLHFTNSEWTAFWAGAANGEFTFG